MTGWRMGFACGPRDVMAVMCKIHQYTMLCAPTPGQYAALEALTSGEQNDYADVRRMVESYDRRRRLIVHGLREAGLACHEPLGAFYAFPAVPAGMDSQTFCEKLLWEQKVAAVPGDAFGELGNGFFRCSYAASVGKHPDRPLPHSRQCRRPVAVGSRSTHARPTSRGRACCVSVRARRWRE